MWCHGWVRLPLLTVTLLGLTLTGCGGANTVTGQVTEAADERLCVQKTTQAGLCFVATAEQLDKIQPGACVEVTFSGSADGDQPVATKITERQPPCVTPER